MIDATATINDFLNAAAAKQPTPGGGAIAALAGALAASMGEMVLGYSVAKKDLLQHSEKNKRAMNEFLAARTALLRLMAEDQAAYQDFTEAKKAGASPIRIRETVTVCIRVPQSIGAAGLAILQIANTIVSTSNKWLLSDLAVCGELAMATVRCAIHNVRVNLGEVADSERMALEGECDRLLMHSIEQINLLMPAIRAIQSTK